MDLGILFGFLGTWLLIAWALLESGDVTMFINAPSFLLVIGASVTVVIYATPMRYVKQIMAILRKSFFFQPESLENLIADMVRFAEIARRDGILSLENSIKEIEDEFIVQGIQMAVDGTDPELIEQIMNNDLENLVERHDVGKGIFDTIGKYAPAFGMIGTLIGLVNMLANMDDPKSIGPAMAVAILTTLYGAIIANLIALPLKDKLAYYNEKEINLRNLMLEGILGLKRGENPRMLEESLHTFLAPTDREALKAAAG